MSKLHQTFSGTKYWPWLVAAWVITLMLGHWGFTIYFHEIGKAKSFVDIAYLDLQLYKLSAGDVSGRVPLPLNIARIAAPAIAAITMIRVGYLFLDSRIAAWRIRRLQNHIVVCGAGDVGFNVAASANAAGRRVVMVERAGAGPLLGKWLARRGFHVAGDVTEPEPLRAAALGRARALVAACDDDGTNVKVLLAARKALDGVKRNTPLACHLQILDYDLSVLFRASTVFRDASGSIDLHVMNAYDTAARIAAQTHPLDRERMGPDDPRTPQLIVLGFGRMGMALALQYAKVSHFANARPLEITVFDKAAAAREKSFHARHPGVKTICSLRFREATFDDAQAIDDIQKLAQRTDALTTIALCISSDSQSLAYALALQQALRGTQVPILVRMATNDGLATLLSGTGAQQLAPFGTLDDVCNWNALDMHEADALAMEVHRLYSAKRQSEGHATAPPWHLLDPELQSSCRQQADHIAVKLRATNCVMERGKGPEFAFTSDEIELLARMEHRRWVAERVLAGWQSGPKDTARRMTPYLVDYNELTDEIKDYDRDAVRNLPKLVAMAGGKIRRV